MDEVKEFKMKLAGREWSRQFYTAVVRSFSKTITEPITNSDTSYKRKFNLSDASGIVEKALSFEKGEKFDLTKVKKEIAQKAPERIIQIHIYTAQGHGHPSRTCEIVDFAEGLSPEELISVFEKLAADKSVVSKGRPGRSLFGRGVSDVLLGHKSGIFYSYHDGVLSKAEFFFDSVRDEEPRVRIKTNKNPSANDLRNIHLYGHQNGSCVRFMLHDDCRIPEEGTLIQILSQFYMLRLINADPNVKIKVFRYRSGGKIYEDSLDYDFPLGDVIEKFSFSVLKPVTGVDLPPIKVDGIVCRVEDKIGLPGKDAGDQRANGLLIVDDKDAVLDLTFLPQFENAFYLNNLYGIIRLTNVRNVIEYFLNTGKDSPLTVTRDGFDTKNDFSKLLFKELAKRLESIYKKEEERYTKSFSSDISAKTRERINEALKELNKFLKEIGEGYGGLPDHPTSPTPSKAFQFLPENMRLTVGKERVARLFLKKDHAKPKTSIIYDTSNTKIEINPLSHIVEDGKRIDEYLIYQIFVKCDSLHENGKITAVAEGKDNLLEAILEISDVTSEITINPPEEMEFRPKESRGQPSRQNNLALYINANNVPTGRKIKITLQKVHGTIGFTEKDKIVTFISVVFDKSHILPNQNIGRILIPWKGSGWGQSARVVAETKRPDGTLIHTEGKIIIEQPEESQGVIKDVKYIPLENQKCSDLVDGIIYINSNHFLNKIVFGANQQDYALRIDKDRTAQYKFSTIIVEQSVFRLAEEYCRENKLIISQDAPVTNLREFVDKKTHDLSPKITKVLMTC